MNRREALRAAGASALSLGFAASRGASAVTLDRAVPATGERLPAIGLGTWITFDVSAGSARASRGEANRATRSSSRTSPSSAMTAPDSALIRVDLPAPLSPTIARISPGSKSKSVASSAVTRP